MQIISWAPRGVKLNVRRTTGIPSQSTVAERWGGVLGMFKHFVAIWKAFSAKQKLITQHLFFQEQLN
jgi:hypothetical protein